MVRVSAVAGLVLLLALGFSFAKGERLQGGQGNELLLQTTPGYNPPDDSPTDTGNGYNPPATDTPGVNPTLEVSTSTPAVTITFTATLPPDAFRTEDSEMGQSKTTPVVTETPNPTLTPYITPTGIKTLRGSTPPAPNRPKEKDAFVMNWGMFLAGFSLPVLAACGYVLYLMDRRPELFRRFRR